MANLILILFSGPSDSVSLTPASYREDMEYETIEEQIARDGEIEHELFERYWLYESNNRAAVTSSKCGGLDGGVAPTEASARRELTIELHSSR